MFEAFKTFAEFGVAPLHSAKVAPIWLPRSSSTTVGNARIGSLILEFVLLHLSLTSVHYCYCEASVWLLCISSLGRSVHSYVCADLLKVYGKAALQRGVPWNSCMEPPLDLPLVAWASLNTTMQLYLLQFHFGCYNFQIIPPE